MKEKRLPNSFFRENPLMDMSAAMIAHFTITQNGNEELAEAFTEIAEKRIDNARRESIQRERQRIEQINDPTLLVETARKGYDVFNQKLLSTKILAFHEQAVPLLLKRYRTCVLDQFIEAATIVLATGEKEYARKLREMYPDIRSPYSQACACLVFGMQGMKEEISFLLDEYNRFLRKYPDETYHQHPLLSLYILHDKF